MSLLTHRIGLTINVLFLAAGCTSAAVDAVLYRLALIAIVLMLRALWAKAVIWKATCAAIDQDLDDAESAFVAERQRRAQRAARAGVG